MFLLFGDKGGMHTFAAGPKYARREAWSGLSTFRLAEPNKVEEIWKRHVALAVGGLSKLSSPFLVPPYSAKVHVATVRLAFLGKLIYLHKHWDIKRGSGDHTSSLW